MAKLLLDITCPSCEARFQPQDMTRGKTPLDPKASWQEVMYQRGGMCCPECGIGLKPDLRSYWPLLSMIPTLLLYKWIPIEIATGVFLIVGIWVAAAMRYGVRYKATVSSSKATKKIDKEEVKRSAPSNDKEVEQKSNTD